MISHLKSILQMNANLLSHTKTITQITRFIEERDLTSHLNQTTT
jgi:hypothetical protein